MPWYVVPIIIFVVFIVAFVILYFVGKKMQVKVKDQQAMIDQSKMTTSILVIDKKKMRIKDSTLPKVVQDQVPFYLRLRKVPLVKAKIGPKIMTLMCDEKVFKNIPVKKQVKVDIAGMYIVGIKGVKASGPKSPSEAKSSTKTSLRLKAAALLKRKKSE